MRVGQLQVIEAEQVQHGGLKVAHAHRVAGDAISEFVGGSVNAAALHAAAGHPHGERVWMMIAAQKRLVSIAILGHRRAAKLAAPNHERLIEQAATTQIADERGNRTIHFAAFFRQLREEIVGRIGAMAVPAPVVELHKAHAALDQAPRKQT